MESEEKELIDLIYIAVTDVCINIKKDGNFGKIMMAA